MANHYGVDESEILTIGQSGRRPRIPRLVAIHLIRVNYYYDIKWKDLSSFFGYKTPTGIINLNSRASYTLRNINLKSLQKQIDDFNQ